ncbi:class I SAM-dependent methyltransferase [Enterobacterales bacterium AE_CKDN230030158-1A_HGKHYDSX7]
MPQNVLSISKPGTRGKFASGLLKLAVLAQLRRLRHGQLSLWADGEELRFGDAGSPLQAHIEVLDPAAWGLVAGNGSIGAGEAYIHGYWRSQDLSAVTRLFVANLDVLDAMEGGLARIGRPALHLLHWLNRNSRGGSRRNIVAHYDLGNALFECLLDPTMMYSAATFATPAQSLEQAQRAKLALICHKLDLQPGDHLLEIGCGWGSLALYAASHHGCRVTTTTLSEEQYAYTCQRVAERGLQGRIRVLCEDYRDLQGRYDKLVSIEMIEAVGHRYLPEYFRRCAALLKEDGLMLLQAITIRDQRYQQACRSVDFIQRYIFPGGALPSLTAMLQTASRETPLNLLHMEDFGPHYALTLKHWLHNLHAAHQTLLERGYDESFQRLWEFYLCYCEGGFQERAIGVAQLLWAGPGARPVPLLERAEPPR